MVVVNDITYLLLEGEGLQFFPSKLFCFENIYSILKLKDFLGLFRHVGIWFSKHASKNDNEILVKAKRKVVANPEWDLYI